MEYEVLHFDLGETSKYLKNAEKRHFDLGTSTEGSNHVMLALSSQYHSRKKKFTNILQLVFFAKYVIITIYFLR